MMKNNRVILAGVIFLVLSIFSCVLMKNSELDIMSVRNFKTDAVVGVNDIVELANYDVTGNNFVVTDSDPRFWIGNFQLDLESIKITFEEPLTETTRIQIYELKSRGTGYEDASAVKYAYEGDTEVYINCDKTEGCSRIRVDIDGDFKLKSIELSSQDYELCKEGTLPVSIWGYVTCIVCAFFISVLFVFVFQGDEKAVCLFENLKEYVRNDILSKKNLWKLVITGVFLVLVAYIYFFLEKNRYVKIELLCILITLFIWIINIKNIKRYFAGIVAATMLFIGLCNIFTMPVASYVSLDDEIHYKKSISLSHIFDGYLTEADVQIFNRNYTIETRVGVDAYNVNKLQELYQGGVVNEKIELHEDMYRQLSYAPAAIGMFVARGLDMSFQYVFYAGKLGVLLLYVILIYYALRRVESGKAIIAVIAMVPTNMFLGTAYAYDVWLTGFLILAIAYIIAVVQEYSKGKKVATKDLIIILSAFVLGLAPKAVYFPLMLLILIIPGDAYENPKIKKVFWIISIICMIFVICTFILPMLIGSESNAQGDLRGGSDVNSVEQIKFILRNPIQYAIILLRHLWMYLSPETQIDTVGIYGYYGNTTHFTLIFITVMGVVLLDREKIDRCMNNWFARCCTFVSVFASLVLVATALYVSFTAVASPTVAGCQFRYIVPCIFPIAYWMFNFNIENKMNKNHMYLAVLLLMSYVAYSDIWLLWISKYC